MQSRKLDLAVMKTIAAKTLALAVALSLAPVFACQDDHEARVLPPADASIDTSQTTFPDSSMPPESGPADVTSDGPLCNGHIPNYMPPPFKPVAMPGVCTGAAIDAYVTACADADGSAACLAWQNDPSNAACKSCIRRMDGTGPLIFYGNGAFAQPNEGGCLALGGAQDCGSATNAAFYCLFEACGSCPLDGGQLTGTCYETVYQGDCESWGNAQDSCESTLTGPVTDCELTNGTLESQMQKSITLFCGVPSDGGGPGDGGIDDSGDGGRGAETGSAEAAAGDAAAGDL